MIQELKLKFICWLINSYIKKLTGGIMKVTFSISNVKISSNHVDNSSEIVELGAIEIGSEMNADEINAYLTDTQLTNDKMFPNGFDFKANFVDNIEYLANKVISFIKTNEIVLSDRAVRSLSDQVIANASVIDDLSREVNTVKTDVGMRIVDIHNQLNALADDIKV